MNPISKVWEHIPRAGTSLYLERINAVYQALYRKYRPSSFDDVISQPHITATLKNQIITGKTAHAYIFTGSRGTGKTTCARILAKALVCEHPVNGGPCLECPVCRDMEDSRLDDVVEIDAASYGSVEDARELREEAYYSPVRCRYRIYIIDEVHMLTPSAFNALLKIIEEPPEHVKFILATTEVHKVLPTILSRCQRFDFRRVRSEDIAERLKYVASKEGFELDSDAAAFIAENADGGMRDALSLLDECVAFSDHVTAQVVSDAAGLTGNSTTISLVGSVCEKNAAEALGTIAALYDGSKDIRQLCTEIILQLRNIMILKSVPDSKGLVRLMPEQLERLKAVAAATDIGFVMNAIDIFGKCAERLARSISARTELEMAVISVCAGSTAADAKPESAPSADTALLISRINELEQRIAALSSARPVPDAAFEPRRQRRLPPAEAASEAKTDLSEARPLPEWPEILEKFGSICPPVSGALQGSAAYTTADRLVIVTENRFFLELLRIKENAVKLSETVFSVTGKKYKIGAKCTASVKDAPDNKLPGLLKKAEENSIPVNTE